MRGSKPGERRGGRQRGTKNKRTLYVSDGTIERFGELLQARPQGVLRLTDELSANVHEHVAVLRRAGQRVLARGLER